MENESPVYPASNWKWFVPFFGLWSDSELSAYMSDIYSVPKVAATMTYHTITGTAILLGLAYGLEKLID